LRIAGFAASRTITAAADSRTAAARHDGMRAVSFALHFVVSVLVSLELLYSGVNRRIGAETILHLVEMA